VIEAMYEDFQKRFPGEMRLLIQNGSLVAVDLQGHSLFSIPGNSIIDFADTRVVQHPLSDLIRLDSDDFSGCGECLPFYFAYVPLLATLDQFHNHPHIFEIAWMEEQALRVTTLKVSQGDYQSLLLHLELLSEADGHDSP
jgi:hypothetical protein